MFTISLLLSYSPRPKQCPTHRGPQNQSLRACLSFVVIRLYLTVSSSVGYLSRKALPIKRNDAEMLTREDVQYDLLQYIFADNTAVFTPQTPGPRNKITFRDLYVNALYYSNKCSKVLKEKMVETPEFGVELAKISILTSKCSLTKLYMH